MDHKAETVTVGGISCLGIGIMLFGQKTVTRWEFFPEHRHTAVRRPGHRHTALCIETGFMDWAAVKELGLNSYTIVVTQVP